MRDKGKGPDPREWGATQLSDGEMDPDEQQVRFKLAKAEENVHEPNRNKKAKAPMNPNSSESEGASDSDPDTKGMSKRQLKKEIKALKQLAKMKNDTHRVKRERQLATPMSNDMKELITKSTEGRSKPGKKLVRTSEQFEEHTYLGKAFRDISEEPDPDDSNDDKSESSSNDDNESSTNNDPGTSDEESGMELMPKKKTESKKKGTKMRKTKTHDSYESERATRVKPTAPEKYDGTPDAVRFYQFVNQSVRYLERGRVPQWDHIAEIANYLKGKAYKFFLTNVSMEMERWTVPKFFKGLFNACFPPTFRMKQMDKLDSLMQGSMTVNEYASELKVLYKIVGYTHKQEKVRKLWRGLVPRLRTHLFEIGYDPERSKWAELVDATETLEIA
ncbi:hypothetical protein H2248_011380 [Termitomyces sp. 'cryptogamus']|nr:hypothetical protein H2248_011380 [Termitomyces sp. 'cryptogamus']